MCGRFTLHKSAAEIIDELDVVEWALREAFRASYNIAPTQDAPVLLAGRAGRMIRPMRWGLVPFWAKDPKIGNRMINARSETLAQKPAFRSLVKGRRCAIMASGYYEWQRTPAGKIPQYLKRPDNRLLLFAGLWDRWPVPAQTDTYLESFTIVTTAAADDLEQIHDRMPATLDAEQLDLWLGAAEDQTPAALALLGPRRGLSWHAVSTFVNSPRNNAAACIQPAAAEPGELF